MEKCICRNFTTQIIATNIVQDGICRNFAECSTWNIVLKTEFARPFFSKRKENNCDEWDASVDLHGFDKTI